MTIKDYVFMKLYFILLMKSHLSDPKRITFNLLKAFLNL